MNNMAKNNPVTRPHYYYVNRDGKKTRAYKELEIGTRRKNRHGYVYIYTRDGFQPEHRVVMEKYLQRRLLKGEVVHHRDGKKDNNKVENLQLLAMSSHHSAIETQHSEDINNLIMIICEQLELLELLRKQNESINTKKCKSKT